MMGFEKEKPSMSRSYKKTPIMENTTCHSERLDKSLWLRLGRRKERINLDALNAENKDDYCTTHQRELSNPRYMGKDGKNYFSPEEQAQFVKRMANTIGQDSQERASLKRLLYKLMGK